MIQRDLNRHDYILLAKMSQQTERFQEMVEYVNKFVKEKQELSYDERTILSTAYKNISGNKRAELRVLSAIELKEQKKNIEKSIEYINQYKEKIEFELQQLCNQILEILDNNLIPNCKDIESKIFYLKMKGDYYRYLAEFLINEEYQQVVRLGTKNYQVYYKSKEAQSLARQNLAPTNSIRLGLDLNISVFYYEILQQFDQAILIAEQAFDESIANIDNVTEEDYKDCALIMQLLRDNLTLWQNEKNEEEQND